MSIKERKLLRKQIDLKIQCMANKESKENDFINSSQLITERQQIYMTISKHFRTQDNRCKSLKLPFDIEKTSLPHVNLSVLNRLYEATNNTMKSPALDKVLNAHSFRTATPFYTNPELTIDRGKVMNYTSHIGAILHTPRYIDFIKKSTKCNTSKKIQQVPKLEHKRKYFSSESRSSTLLLSISLERSEKDTIKSSTVSARSINSHNSYKESDFENESGGQSKRSNYNQSRSSPNMNENLTLNSVAGFQENELYKVCDESKHSPTENKKSAKDCVNQTGLLEEGNQNLDETCIVDAVEIFFSVTEMKKEDFDIINRYFETVNKYRFSKLEYVEDYGIHLLGCNQLFGDFHRIISRNNVENISDEDCASIKRIIETYALNNPKVLNKQEAKEVIKCNETEKFPEDVDFKISKGRDSVEELKDDNRSLFEEDKEIESEIKNILTKIINDKEEEFPNDEYKLKSNQENRDVNKDYKNEIAGQEKTLTEETNEINDASNNVFNTLKRIFPIEEIMRNYDIKIETDDNEDTKTNQKEETDEKDDNENAIFEKKEEKTEEKYDYEYAKSNKEEDLAKEKDENKGGKSSKKENKVKEKEDNEDPKSNIEEVEEINDYIEDEEFAESFRNLFRNSIAQMNTGDFGDLKRLVNNYTNEEESRKRESTSDLLKSFKELFMIEKDKMSSNDKNNLIKLFQNDLQINDRSSLGKFEELLKRYNGSISENDFVKMRQLINEENTLINNEEDIAEEKEDNEIMLAFRNLFRSSIGEIKTKDLTKISNILEKHEYDDN